MSRQQNRRDATKQALSRAYAHPAVQRVGFVDETERRVDDITSLYGVVLVTYPVDALQQVRDRLVRQWRTGAGQESSGAEYWHTTDVMRQGAGGRVDHERNRQWVREMAGVMSDTLHEHRLGASPAGVMTVTVNVPLGDDLAKRQARDECLKWLTVAALKNRESGPNLLVMDKTSTHRRDLDVVADARQKLQERGMISPQQYFRVEHAHMGDEPMMWVADMMAWGLQREITAKNEAQRGPFVEHLRQHVRSALTIDLPSGATKVADGLTARAEGSAQSAAVKVRASAMVDGFERDYAEGRIRPQPGREGMRADQAYHRSIHGNGSHGRGGYGR